MTDLRPALHEAAGRPRTDLDLADLDRRTVRRRRARRRGRAAALGTAAVVVVALGAVWAASTPGRDDSGVVTSGPRDDAPGWTRLPDGPLSPRTAAGMFWTGEEVLVVGGSDIAPSGLMDDGPIVRPPLQDGAAYDPSTRTWRRIADAPAPVADGPGAVVGGDLYLLDRDDRYTRGPPDTVTVGTDVSAFLRYDPDADRWTELPAPPAAEERQLVAVGDRLVASLGEYQDPSDHDGADLVWEPATETWGPLPPAPGPSSERRVVALDGALYVFSRSADPEGAPPLVRGTMFILGGESWALFSDSTALGTEPVGTEGVIVDPSPGGADGGETGNWGRTYPNRWLYDTDAGWGEMPAPPDARTGVQLPTTAGAGRVVAGNAVFDVHRRSWSRLDAPAALDGRFPAATWADDRLMAFGGSTAGDGPEDGPPSLHADLWQWIPAD